jgi:hypothetical protein
MKLSTFFAVTGIIALLFGAFFLILPELALRQYGVPTDAHNQMQARYFGATLLQVGLVVWLSRLTQDAISVRAILIAIIVGNACAPPSVFGRVWSSYKMQWFGALSCSMACCFWVVSTFFCRRRGNQRESSNHSIEQTTQRPLRSVAPPLMSNIRPHLEAAVPTPRKNKDDLWAEFQQKTGADKQVVSAKALAIGLVVILLIVAVFALR